MDGWVDLGERAAVESVAPFVRGRPILDVGVGAGRTVSIMRLISDDYVAIDYTPEQVQLCKEDHPGVDVRLVDARDLSQFPAAHFALVLFSFNGLDSVTHEDREGILAGFHRVLEPEGLLVFSTMNRDGPFYRLPPWRVRDTSQPLSRRVARFLVRLPLRAGHYRRSYRNWFRHSRLMVDHEGWGLAPVNAHEFGIVFHFVSLDAQIAELDRMGFDVVTVFDRERGAPLPAGVDTSSVKATGGIIGRACRTVRSAAMYRNRSAGPAGERP
ncbi:MAG: class I SAM-dependent methyltransferase [Acidimicrobiales bacterium]